MKKIIFLYLIIALLISALASCKKDKTCDSPDRKYCYRELATYNVIGCTYISPCDKIRKQQFQNACPSGYEVIWNP